MKKAPTRNPGKNRTLKVGILVITGLAIFITGIFVIGRQENLFGSTFTLRSSFSGVSGLQVGNNVRFNGINVGTVSDIILYNDTSVMVHMLVEKPIQKFIRKNSRCVIGSEGLMGDKVITITSGSEEYEQIGDKDMLPSETPIEMDAVMVNLKNTAENAEIISQELAVIMYKVNNGKGTLSRLLSDSSIASDITTTLENLKSTSENLDVNMEAAKKSFLLRGAVRRMEKDAKEKSDKERSK